MISSRGSETLLADEALRDLCARAVKLVGAMSGPADQDEARITDQREQRVEVVAGSVEHAHGLVELIDQYDS